MKVSLILTCAGKGERAGFAQNKLLQKIDGQPVVSLSLNAFMKTGLIDEYVVTASKTDFESIKSLCPSDVKVIEGGQSRTRSVANALNVIGGDVVLIHDGARPFVSEAVIKRVTEVAKKFGSAIPVVPSADTVVKAENQSVSSYEGKLGLYRVQTPQGFNAKQIKAAYKNATRDFNDDGEIYLNEYGKLNTVEGSEKNVKLTYPEDFEKASAVNGVKFGVGFDCHRLVNGRKLILGGVKIPHDKGLLGHSDADVLTHAIMDAILSALALRDIGYHFSDKDPKYKDADSMKLLEKVLSMAKEKGYAVKSVSAVIMAEKPKLLKHVPVITKSLANALSLSENEVGIGATTLEGLGFVGREEGICVQATAVLEKIR